MIEQDTLIEEALEKYPKAKRIAVENFVMSAWNGPESNRYNLFGDTILYNWNNDTVRAIRYCLKKEGKI